MLRAGGVLLLAAIVGFCVVESHLACSELKKGNALEWQCSSDDVHGYVSDWKVRHVFHWAVADVTVDTLLFIPGYSLLAFALFRRLQSKWSRFAPMTLAIGALDLIENGGIYAELAGHSAVAPFTFAISAAKWISALVMLIFYIVAARPVNSPGHAG